MSEQLGLAMELRDVQEPERLIVGVVVPYDEITYMTPNPGGERVKRGAFKRSIDHKMRSHEGIGLFRNHEHGMRMGKARKFVEDPSGLVGEFVVNDGPRGDEFLDECRDGYYGGLSVGMIAKETGRSADGVREIRVAALGEVSTVGLPAYAGAAILAVRNARDVNVWLEQFRNRPAVNLDPVPPILYGRR